MASQKFVLFIAIIYLHFAYGDAEKLKCYQCAGHIPNCSQQPDEVSAFECFGNDAKCYTLLNGYGYNQRGCTDSLHYVCNNITNCQTCDNNLCNNKIFPIDRLQCYHCIGEDCKTINNTYILPCQTYKNSNDSQCYTYIDDKNIITRGCLIDNSDLCNNNLMNCHKCNGTNCNKKNYNEIVPIKTTIRPTPTTEGPIGLNNQTCYKCRSDVDKYCTNSLEGFHNIKPEKCNIVPSKDFGCFIKRIDSRVIRGCLSDLDDGTNKECRDIGYENCRACYRNGCNIGAAPNNSTTIFINKILLNFLCIIAILKSFFI